jgi:hypothetical protein
MKMPEKTAAGKARKAPAKKAGGAGGKSPESKSECFECPIAKAMRLCDETGWDFKGINISDFLAHMAGARREFLMGIKSMLEEAIRLEDERIERRQAASTRKKQSNKEQVHRIPVK